MSWRPRRSRRCPKIGVPTVIIHFRWGFSLKLTILGYRNWMESPTVFWKKVKKVKKVENRLHSSISWCQPSFGRHFHVVLTSDIGSLEVGVLKQLWDGIRDGLGYEWCHTSTSLPIIGSTTMCFSVDQSIRDQQELVIRQRKHRRGLHNKHTIQNAENSRHSRIATNGRQLPTTTIQNNDKRYGDDKHGQAIGSYWI